MIDWLKSKFDRPLPEPDWSTVMPKLARYDHRRHREHPKAPVWRKFLADLALEYSYALEDDEASVTQAQALAKGLDEPQLHQLALSHLAEELQDVAVQQEPGYFIVDQDQFSWGPELLLLPPASWIDAMGFLQGDPLVTLPCRFTLFLTGTGQQFDEPRDGLRFVGSPLACKGLMAQRAKGVFDGVPSQFRLSEYLFSVADGQWVAGDRLADVELHPVELKPAEGDDPAVTPEREPGS